MTVATLPSPNTRFLDRVRPLVPWGWAGGLYSAAEAPGTVTTAVQPAPPPPSIVPAAVTLLRARPSSASQASSSSPTVRAGLPPRAVATSPPLVSLQSDTIPPAGVRLLSGIDPLLLLTSSPLFSPAAIPSFLPLPKNPKHRKIVPATVIPSLASLYSPPLSPGSPHCLAVRSVGFVAGGGRPRSRSRSLPPEPTSLHQLCGVMKGADLPLHPILASERPYTGACVSSILSAKPPHYPVQCTQCQSQLVWPVCRGQAFRVSCFNCWATSTMSPWSCAQPSVPLTAPTHSQPYVLQSALPVLTQFQLPWRSASVDLHRWASLRAHPTVSDLVVVVAFDVPLAVVPYRTAAWLRRVFILAWRPRRRSSLPLCDPPIPLPFPASFVVNEGDVAAGIVQFCLSNPGAWQFRVPESFPGDQHVFAPWDYIHEPGYLRPASLPVLASHTHFAAPSSSAFTDLTTFGSPLSASGHLTALAMIAHPLTPFLVNSVRFGFPLLAHVPSTTRYCSSHTSPFSSGPLWEALCDKEFSIGAFVPASDFPSYVPLRFHPFFAVEKEPGVSVRGIGDLSFGVASTNAGTRRGSHPRADLMPLESLFGRLLYLSIAFPGEPRVIFALDCSSAFRRLPVPARDFHKAAHVVRGVPVVNARSAMGAIASGDSMSQSTTSVCDVAQAFGVWLRAYVDDFTGASLARQARRDLPIARALLAVFGWLESEAKARLPAPVHPILGVLIDAQSLTASVTPQRQAKLVSVILSWLSGAVSPSRSACRKLAGHLQFVSAVLPAARCFITPLYDVIYSEGGFSSSSVLASCGDSLRWFLWVLQHFNGSVSLIPPAPSMFTIRSASDASGFGVGGWCFESAQYFSHRWSSAQSRRSTTAIWEAVGVVLCLLAWGHMASGSFMLILTDSAACAAVFSREHARDPKLRVLLSLFSIAQLHWRVRVVVQHLSGSINTVADSLSRTLLPPQSHSYLQPLVLPPPCYRMQGLLSLPSHKVRSLVRGPSLQPSELFNSIVTLLAGPSPLPMPWTNSRLILPQEADWLTLPPSSSYSAPGSLLAPLPTLSVPSGPTFLSHTAMSSHGLRSCPSSSSDTLHTRMSDGAGSPCPKSSSLPLLATIPSTSLSELRSSLPSTGSCVSQSTLPHRRLRMTPPSPFSGVTSVSCCRPRPRLALRRALQSRSGSSDPSLIEPTLVRTCSSSRLPILQSAQRRGFARICQQRLPHLLTEWMPPCSSSPAAASSRQLTSRRR